MTDQESSSAPSNRPFVIAGLATLLLCLSVCALAVITDRSGVYSAATLRYGTRVCVGVGTLPDVQVMLAWEVPRLTVVLSSWGPSILHSSTALCAFFPLELPYLPLRGALAFPPGP